VRTPEEGKVRIVDDKATVRSVGVSLVGIEVETWSSVRQGRAEEQAEKVKEKNRSEAQRRE
jgi:hypothetical protein